MTPDDHLYDLDNIQKALIFKEITPEESKNKIEMDSLGIKLGSWIKRRIDKINEKLSELDALLGEWDHVQSSAFDSERDERWLRHYKQNLNSKVSSLEKERDKFI